MSVLRSYRFAALAAVAALAAGLVISVVSAQTPTVSVGSFTLGVGQDGTVSLRALDMPEPGLGAWTVDITYNAEVVSVLDCDAENGGVCNPAFNGTTIRVVGTSVFGLPGDSVLATIDFSCDAVGASELSLAVRTLVDATPGDLQDIDAATVDGVLTCTAQTQPTPTPEPPPGPEGLPGDVNCDEAVTSVDAALVLQYGVDLIDGLECPENGDLNEDGSVNAVDAAIILQIVAGLI